MERAARLIKNDKRTQQILSPDEIVRGIWPAAVGEAIARHTVRLKVVRSTLVVEVEDATWQKQLFPLSAQIVHRVRKLLGNSDIEHVEFRAGALKRPMQREERIAAAQDGAQDEADSILDPVLKKIYRNSRKRATA
jgi:predicted nucleic acid-binding Zn ribbon protein